MLLLTFFALLISLSCSAAADGGPYNYGMEARSIYARSAATDYVTTGIPTSTNGTLPLRLEIRDLEKDNATWTLFILALDMMQYTNQSEIFSWYQIAGIHGRPFYAWDNVNGPVDDQGNGYCTHVSILFPTWHRPYLALYEQILYGMAQYIATLYPVGSVRDEYIAAANRFRIPYWDWAAVPSSAHTTADSIMTPTVSVAGPNGVQTIHNPLFNYDFKPLITDDLPDAPFDVFRTTQRWPTNMTAASVSRNDQMAAALDNSASSLRNRLYNLFTNYQNYTEFSNEAFSNSVYYDSIESVHDFIHGYTGNGGHMTYIEYSAFDPIFFLHHTMIDRCFALWQVLNPDGWIQPEPATYSTFTTTAGDIEDSRTPLTPFRNDSKGGFWISDTSRETAPFGYAYPETVGGPGVDVKSVVTNAINNLYGTTAPANVVSRDQFVTRRSTSEVQNRALSYTNAAGLPHNLVQNNQYSEWIVNIRVQKRALSAPFFIHIFLGVFDPDPATWPFEPNLVGSHSVFTMAPKGIDNCVQCNPEQVISGTVPLTSALLADISKGSLQNLDSSDVVPHLNANLRYKVAMADGTEVGNVDSLSINVVSASVQKPDGELPIWGAMQVQIESVSCG
ncbi:hypothetical protein BP6252_02821 [Coleophoma cylindrospora]|uniref:Tyrosinase copper-binding domain-containing protein n=1 Tax=Coleophoma cylindrospora TaxID=1849047 RepID=A0A3D8SGC1_9HELO|nr:hypothetical protein BP6252_02821 [Coleophoma cylindrospora]